MPFMVELSCLHTLWPGNRALFKKGDNAYCKTCRSQQTVTKTGDTRW